MKNAPRQIFASGPCKYTRQRKTVPSTYARIISRHVLHLLHYPCATAHTKLGLVIVGVSAIALRAAELGTVVDHLARALRFRFD